MFSESKAWERGSFRSRQRFHAFSHARDLPPADRSLRAAYNAHRTQCLGKSGERGASGRWELWSREDDWVARLELWDGFVDAQQRAAFLKEQVEAARRHARAIQAAISVATIPVRIALETAATPDGLDRLRTAARADASGLRAAVTEARRSAASLPALVSAERLTLGMSTEKVEIDDTRESDASFADRIVQDPVATDLAIRLLDQLARSKAPLPNDGAPPLVTEPVH